MTAARNPQTFLDRDNWMRAVNASGLPPAVRILAIGIALHVNVETGQCNPGHGWLSKETGISTRSINRFVAWLQRAGWLAVRRRGRSNNNSYVLLRPAKTLADQEPVRPAKTLADQKAQENYDPPNRASMIRQNAHYDPPHAVAQKENLKANKRTEGEKDPLPDVALPDLKKGSAAKKSKPQAKPKPEPEVAEPDAFERFLQAYPKRVAKEAARKAFAAVVKRGVDPEILVAGAARYALERARQPARWTKHPATWLNGGCWDDEPDGTVVVDEDGKVVAIQQEESSGDTVADIVEAALEQFPSLRW